DRMNYMFGGGMRKCPGRNLAMVELKATLVMLYRKYDIELMSPLKETIKT
ncbi:3666_t:CDS:2, partial [Acaulospora morrowiae]